MITPPIRPILAAPADQIPPGMLYEPKWDGWRCVTFVRDGRVTLWSRHGTEMTSDFPELVSACRDQLPDNCVVDGELVMVDGARLEYSKLAKRHAAGDKSTTLAALLPVTYVIFDLIDLDGHDCRPLPQQDRRDLLEQLLDHARPPLALTPATQDLAVAHRWFDALERYGLDGVVAKPLNQPYLEGSRALVKIKHKRTADVVVAAFRWDRNATQHTPTLGSLLLGVWTEEGHLHFLGVVSGFPQSQRMAMAQMLGELVVAPGSPEHRDHPWHPSKASVTRIPDMTGGRQRGHEQVRLIAPQLACEVTFDALHPDPEGVRIRSNARFVRWRPDKPPETCMLSELDHRPQPDPAEDGLQRWLTGDTTVMEESP